MVHAKKLGSAYGMTMNLEQLTEWHGKAKRVMKEALMLKFTAHKNIRDRLVATGSAELQEWTPKDDRWGMIKMGDGTRKGNNWLGKALMQVRAHFQAQQGS